MTWVHISDACAAACENVGIRFQHFQPDDQFHPVDSIDGKPGNKAGRIKLFADGQGGIVFNFKTGQQQPFFTNGRRGEQPSPGELERVKQEQQRREAERLRGYDRVARVAVAKWDTAQPAKGNEYYLVKKNIGSHGARVANWQRSIPDLNGNKTRILIEGALIFPLCNERGQIRSLQAIFPEKHPQLNRDKDFLPGGQLAGLFWWIGAKTDTVLICEGFATACTLHEESGYRVYMAFSANNLLSVARTVRGKMPGAQIIVCSDNDLSTPGNPGLTKATAAAEAINAELCVSPVESDFNDYAIILKAANAYDR